MEYTFGYKISNRTKNERLARTLDVINYKMENYENKCEPITKELIKSLKNKRETKS
ncbi:MAG: hypothetical protein ACLT69_11900 [Intestinibacter bartlettii]